nr:oligosaccharide flippase family protein [Providencia sp. PROV129]
MSFHVFKGASYTLIGNLSFAFSQWAILIIINKMGTTNDVGIFTLALAILNPIFMMAQGGLRSYIVIDTNRSFKFRTYFQLRVLFSILALFISLLFVFKENYLYSVLLLALYKIFDNLFDIFYGEYQRKDTMKKIAISRTSRGLANLIFFLLSYILTKNLNIALLSYVLSSSIIFVLYDYRNYNFKLEDSYTPPDVLKKLAKLSFPLAITAMLISLNTNLPRLFLENNSGLTELGAFGSFMYIITVAQIIIQSICQAFVPKIAHAYNENRIDDFIKTVKLLLCFTIFISIAFCVFAIFFKDIIFLLIFNAEYEIFYSLYDNIIMISPFIFLCLVLGNINTARRRIKYQPYIFLSILIINIPTSFILINYLSANGAVLSSLIVSILTIIILSIYSIKGREGWKFYLL